MNNLKNKRVLITGSDGFIGSHLVERLLQEGCYIRAFVLYNSFNSWGWLEDLSKEDLERIEVFLGDVRDFNRVRKAIEDTDVIFHLASLVSIPYSYLSCSAFVDTNVKGALNILQAAKDCKVKKVLVTSTSEVYGTAQYVPIDEKHPKQSQSPYSATKIAADFLAESFYRSFGLPVIIVRPFNTYGPRQSERAIIPTIITQLLAGSSQIRLGSLYPKRDFVYVKDTVDAFVEIAKLKDVFGEEINIATQTEVTIGELANILVRMINPKAQIYRDKERVRPAHSEIERLLGSNRKIKRLTGWYPKHTLEEGLRRTVEWFKKNLKFYKPYLYNV